MDYKLIKQMWREDIRFQAYTIGILLTVANLLFYAYIPDCIGCTITSDDGIQLKGSCDQAHRLMKAVRNGDLSPEELQFLSALETGEIDNLLIEDKVTDEATTTTSTTSTTTSSTTTTLSCPVCPIKECGPCVCNCPPCLVKDCASLWRNDPDFIKIKEQLYNMRPDIENAAAQHGFYSFRCAMKEAFGDNCSMYREGPSLYSYSLLGYGLSEAEDIRDGMYCFNRYNDSKGPYFNITQYPDELGRKRWTWRCDGGSSLQVYHL